MRWLRIPIAGLMLLLLPVAIGLAALREPSELWASALFSLTVLALLASALGTAARRGSSRMAFLGFTLFGGSYLALAFGPWVWVNRDGLRPPPLVTGILLSRIQESQAGPTTNWKRNSKDVGSSMSYTITPPHFTLSPADLTHRPEPSGSLASGPPDLHLYVPYDVSPYKQIAHSMLALLVGTLGAIVGRAAVPRKAGSRQVSMPSGVMGEP